MQKAVRAVMTGVRVRDVSSMVLARPVSLAQRKERKKIHGPYKKKNKDRMALKFDKDVSSDWPQTPSVSTAAAIHANHAAQYQLVYHSPPPPVTFIMPLSYWDSDRLPTLKRSVKLFSYKLILC